MATENEINDERYAALNHFIDSLETTEGALIGVLHEAQNIFGYLPNEVQNHIAHRLALPSSKVYGTVTFYSFFSTKPKGKYQINVCMGTACFIRGAQKVLDKLTADLGIDVGHATKDNLFSLDAIRCVGACGLAPVVSINGKVYGKVTPDDVSRILSETKEEAPCQN